MNRFTSFEQQSGPHGTAPVLRIGDPGGGFTIGESRPPLSWQLPSSASQQAYEVEVVTRGVTQSSDWVTSPDSVRVPWPFEALHSRDAIDVRVRVASVEGDVSAWSEFVSIEVALLTASDWIAVPVTSPLLDDSPTRPVRFRRSFASDGGVAKARLYISALGVYAAEINGEPVGDHVLAPGWSSYSHRLLYDSFDVTDAVQAGNNVIGVTVAEGWYRGRLGFGGGRRAVYGDQIGPIAQLELTLHDGRVQTIATDGDWRSSFGPHVDASLYDGEHFDARLIDRLWSTPASDDTGWSSVECLASVADRLVAPTGPPVRRIDEIAPTQLITSPSGKLIVDFGQNISGWTRISVAGRTGDTVTLRHAEVLENGELGVRPLRHAAATDSYVVGHGGTETWEPSFTVHGFRYVEVSGWPGTLDPGDIRAIVCHSAMERTGSFECSHAGLQQLHDNVVWSMRGNFVHLPTDCPQRDERLGWTGDLQIFAPSAAFLYDCRGLLDSWLADLAAEQLQFGTVPVFVPWMQLNLPALPAAAWGDAAVIVPWVLYEHFADRDLLRRQYPSMCAWVDQIADLAGADHLWDDGFQYGDWLDPTAPPDEPSASRTDRYLVATAYHAHSARLLAHTARALGESADEARYSALAEDVIDAFNAEYVTPSGRLASDSPTAYALALHFELFKSPRQRDRAADRLAELVALDGYRIATGFVGTPIICDALANSGHLDAAYHLLLQDECPSWLYPVTMGATTMWERWDSMLEDGSINPGEMTSFNHYALGAVADFLHRVVAGLSPAAPGYREVLIRPRPGGGLTAASASLQTPYGDAAVAWVREGELLTVTSTVPPGVTATVELPGDAPVSVGPGVHRMSSTVRAAEADPSRPKRLSIEEEYAWTDTATESA